MSNKPASQQTRLTDWLIFLAVPFFFSSNVIFGRGVVGEVSPFIAAFIRWIGSTLIIAPFMIADWRNCLAFVRRKTLLWLVLGILGMGICGGVVYWGLTMTTAANGTLIYTTSSLFIILFQRVFQGRPIRKLEVAGMVIAFAGVAAIVLKGDMSALWHLNFNIGDFAILTAAIALFAAAARSRRTADGLFQPFRPDRIFRRPRASAAGGAGTGAGRHVARHANGLGQDRRHHPVRLTIGLLLLHPYGARLRARDRWHHALHDAAGLDPHGHAVPGGDFRDLSRHRHRAGHRRRHHRHRTHRQKALNADGRPAPKPLGLDISHSDTN
jgi:uncharacterized membrane protein